MEWNLASLRLGTKTDIPAIASLVNNAFRVEDFLEGNRTDEQNILSSMGKGRFFIVEDSLGHLVASIYVELRGERGYFGMLAVEPTLQRTGIGRQMIEFAENFARDQGCQFMDLKVLSPRKELPAFYQRLGYAVTGTEEFISTRPLKTNIECFKILMSKAL